MTYDPHRRDSSWTMVKPGLYLDPAGRGHVFPDEIIAQLQILHPDTGFTFSREDYDLVLETLLELLREQHPEVKVKFIYHERNVA